MLAQKLHIRMAAKVIRIDSFEVTNTAK